MQSEEAHKDDDSLNVKAAAPTPLSRGATFARALLFLVVAWSATHRLLGFAGDAKLYAFQALARIHPALNRDIFLEYASQDRFTIFSPFYAWCIELLGMNRADMVLTIFCKAGFFVAAWALARALWKPQVAFLVILSLIVVAGSYGGGDVFRYAEDWLTARSVAEPMVVAALALYFRDHKFLACLVVVAALLVHPLVALPGVLLLLCLATPSRFRYVGAATALALALIVASAVPRLPGASHIFPLMDESWLEIVRQRSEYLFLDLWTLDDWKLNCRPFIALTFASLAINDNRVRNIAYAAMLVGAAGLAVSLIASLVAPVSILIQGQAWRWVWVTTLTAVLLLVPTMVRVWREWEYGPLCAILLLLGWAASSSGVYFTAAATLLWLSRRHLPATLAPGRRITLLQNLARSTSESFSRVMKQNSTKMLATSCLALIAACAFLLPNAFKEHARSFATSEDLGFDTWRTAIPPDANVLLMPPPISAAFAWFVLQRPSYLSLDQSSGVVFSRETALEIRRRSEIARPPTDASWRILSRHIAARRIHGQSGKPAPPLTARRLFEMCHDPKLNFVVAKENVGFHPLPNTHAGAWLGWNLYDCSKVISSPPFESARKPLSAIGIQR
jgi:hypothetical protein